MGERRATLLVLGGLLSLVGVLYRESFFTMARKWGDDTTFSHGYLILPICLWLVWRRRDELRAVEWRPSAVGALIALAAAVLWVVARGTGVLVIEQAAALTLVPAAIMTVMGSKAARVLAFPLGFLYFSVPFGRALIPWLMQVTAVVATHMLAWSGVPIHRTEMTLSIPQGHFLVAKACGGLGYAITGLALGVVYAYLTYTRWWKRVVAIAAFLVLPILANGVRVYLTIGVSYLTDMRFGPGYEHVTFGRIFFVVVMLAMFYVGQRWRDAVDVPAPSTATHDAVHVRWQAYWPVAALTAALIAAQLYLAIALARAGDRIRAAETMFALPEAAAGWRTDRSARPWRPSYSGAAVENSATYRDGSGRNLDAYLGIYGPGGSGGGEMISSENRILPDEDRYLYATKRRRLVLGGGQELRVNEQVSSHVGNGYVIWHWFVVGPRTTTQPFLVKAYEAVEFLTNDPQVEMVVTLATPADDHARQRLHAFVSAHATCIAGGFRSATCR